MLYTEMRGVECQGSVLCVCVCVCVFSLATGIVHPPYLSLVQRGDVPWFKGRL